MKRIVIALFFLFFFIAPWSPVGATCVATSLTKDCQAGFSQCGVSLSGNYCCTDVSQCSNPTKFVSGAGAAPAGASGSNELQGVCASIQNGKEKGDCEKCFEAENSWTALGCISTDPASFVGTFLGFGTGIAGGIAFLLILFGGFQILTSAGNPEQLNAGRELITSAVAGLLLIIFSIFILKLIGVDILKIPSLQ